MNNVIPLAITYFVKIILVLNILYLLILFLQGFEFYRTPFFVGVAKLIYLILSPIYELIDKIIDKTIFGEGNFYKQFKQIAIAFIVIIILTQIYMFVEANYLTLA